MRLNKSTRLLLRILEYYIYIHLTNTSDNMIYILDNHLLNLIFVCIVPIVLQKKKLQLDWR